MFYSSFLEYLQEARLITVMRQPNPVRSLHHITHKKCHQYSLIVIATILPGQDDLYMVLVEDANS